MTGNSESGSKRPLAVGDEVRAYEGTHIYRGKVTQLWPRSVRVTGTVEFSWTDAGPKCGAYHDGYYHPKQIRRLKPKAKSVRVTREMLADAIGYCGYGPHLSDAVAKALGLGE